MKKIQTNCDIFGLQNSEFFHIFGLTVLLPHKAVLCNQEVIDHMKVSLDSVYTLIAMD